MIELKDLVDKYSPLGLESTVITYMYTASDEAERKRMLEDDGYFFDKYQAFMYAEFK